MIDSHDADDSRWTRRGFIAGGSVLLSAILLGSDLAAPLPDGLGVLAAAGPQIAVGFVEGSTAGSSLRQMLAAGRVRVRPASQVSAGSAVRGPAAVSVLGFSPHTSIESGAVSSVYLDTLITSPVRGESDLTIPFYAFTARAKPAPMTSSPSRFVIAGGDSLRVGLGLSTSMGSEARSTATTVFTSGSGTTLPKLRDGVYLLGLRPGMWQTDTDLPEEDDPSWADLPSLVVSVEPTSVA